MCPASEDSFWLVRQSLAFDKRFASLVFKSLDLAHGGKRAFAQAIQEFVQMIGSQRLNDEMQLLDSSSENIERGTDLS